MGDESGRGLDLCDGCTMLQVHQKCVVVHLKQVNFMVCEYISVKLFSRSPVPVLREFVTCTGLGFFVFSISLFGLLACKMYFPDQILNLGPRQ